MGQNLAALTVQLPGGGVGYVQGDSNGNIKVVVEANFEELLTLHGNITGATVVKATPGTIGQISVLVAGNTTGSVNDAATTGNATVANQLAAIPNALGVINLDFNTTTGIVVTPGTGQTVAVTYK